MPIIAIMSSGVAVIHSAQNTPANAISKEPITALGNRSDSNNAAITR